VARNGVVCVGYGKLAGTPAKNDVGERTGPPCRHALLPFEEPLQEGSFFVDCL
jgi:hypothetical protein